MTGPESRIAAPASSMSAPADDALAQRACQPVEADRLYRRPSELHRYAAPALRVYVG
jgi:hypothetical protein